MNDVLDLAHRRAPTGRATTASSRRTVGARLVLRDRAGRSRRLIADPARALGRPHRPRPLPGGRTSPARSARPEPGPAVRLARCSSAPGSTARPACSSRPSSSSWCSRSRRSSPARTPGSSRSTPPARDAARGMGMRGSRGAVQGGAALRAAADRLRAPVGRPPGGRDRHARRHRRPRRAGPVPHRRARGPRLRADGRGRRPGRRPGPLVDLLASLAAACRGIPRADRQDWPARHRGAQRARDRGSRHDERHHREANCPPDLPRGHGRPGTRRLRRRRGPVGVGHRRQRRQRQRAARSSSGRRTSRRTRCWRRSTPARSRRPVSTTETKLNIGSREVYLKALEPGDESVDIFPEYTGVLRDYFDEASDTGHRVRTRSTTSWWPSCPTTSRCCEPSSAEDKDARRRHAGDRRRVLPDRDRRPRAGRRRPDAGRARRSGRPATTGVPGLEEVYGVTFGDFRALDAGGPLTLNALLDGQIDAGNLFTTDPNIAAEDLVVLEDPESLFAAQNVVPLVRSEVARPTTSRRRSTRSRRRWTPTRSASSSPGSSSTRRTRRTSPPTSSTRPASTDARTLA